MKKVLKKLVTVLLCLTMLLSTSPMIFAAQAADSQVSSVFDISTLFDTIKEIFNEIVKFFKNLFGIIKQVNTEAFFVYDASVNATPPPEKFCSENCLQQ